MFEQDRIAISHLVAMRCGWSEARRARVEREYAGFLEAAARGGAGRPSEEVDALWHEHILNSASYVRYCEANFGGYVHHQPHLSQVDGTRLKARLDGRTPDFVRLAEVELAANCGAPDQPDDDPPPGRLANCGAQEPVPPPDLGFAPVMRANCGAPTPVPHQEPVPPPR
ncbi:hypothetical protein [Phenylobacterium montanum]|uniref:Uncharacterized protein n=1 Tax=Phenylobacterium montanum TaxID=2823693 RepID=A0A975FZG4_9CAUL|nr:hypothetical protein [Caulobacter sp. S6]QUD87804.1 hypothetical protein KCG34_22620 [Caulobacter sp. S6]